MATVNDVYRFLDSIAPFATQMEFDNSGFLVGRSQAQADTVLVTLDITPQTVQEAAELGAQLIVSHHPVVFEPIKAVTDGDVTGRLLLALIEHGIAAICAHTNLDAAQGGVNDQLARTLGLTGIGQLHQDGTDASGRPYGIGRVGVLPEAQSAAQFAAFVRRQLGASGVRFADAGRPVRCVAVGGGACGGMLSDAVRAGCDTFVTADVKYHVFLEASALGVNLLDAGHFPTENVVCAPLAEELRAAFPGMTVALSQVHREVFSTLSGI